MNVTNRIDSANLESQNLQQGSLNDHQVCHCRNWSTAAKYAAIYVTVTSIVSLALIVFSEFALVGIATFVSSSILGIGIGCALNRLLSCRCTPLNKQEQQQPALPTCIEPLFFASESTQNVTVSEATVDVDVTCASKIEEDPVIHQPQEQTARIIPSEIIAVESVQEHAEEKMLKDIRKYVICDELYTLFQKAIVEDFKNKNPQTFTSWECRSDGTFKLQLSAPQKKWVAAYGMDGKTTDPPWGMVHLYGVNEEGKTTNKITGKLTQNKIQITSGWNLYVDPDIVASDYLPIIELKAEKPGEITMFSVKDLNKCNFLVRLLIKLIKSRYGATVKDNKAIFERRFPLVMLVENWTKYAESAVNDDEVECLKKGMMAFKQKKIIKTGRSAL